MSMNGTKIIVSLAEWERAVKIGESPLIKLAQQGKIVVLDKQGNYFTPILNEKQVWTLDESP